MKKINGLFLFLSVIFLMALMIVAVINMILRPFGHPLVGSFELMGYASALVTAFGLGYSQEKRGHISVDILFKHLPRKLKAILSFIGGTLSGAFFLLCAYKMLMLGITYIKSGELSETLNFPFYPVTLGVALGLFLLAINCIYATFKGAFLREKN